MDSRVEKCMYGYELEHNLLSTPYRVDNIDENEFEFKICERKYRPKFETLFNFALNPLVANDQDIHHCVLWAYECSLMSEEQYDRIKGTYLFMYYFYPFCSHEFLMETIVKLNMITFVWDDHSERYGGDVGRSEAKAIEIWTQYMNALDHLHDGPELSMAEWKPYTLAIYSIFEDFYQSFNDIQKRRFIEVWKVYVSGNIEECRIFGNKIAFTLNEYLPIRRKSVCVLPYLQVIEYSQSICLSDEEWNDPKMQAFHSLTTDCMIYVNDIWSFEKEFREQNSDRERLQYMNNVVAIAVGEKRCSIAEAMNYIIEENKDLECRTKALMYDILEGKGVSEAVKIYLNCVHYSLGSNMFCPSILDRYNKYY